MRIRRDAVNVLRRAQSANMPDTARVIGIASVYGPGGTTRPAEEGEADVATVACRISPMTAANTVVAGQELADSSYVIVMPLVMRDIVNKDHEIEGTSVEFGWTKHFVVDRVSDHYTNEVCVKAYCSETASE